MRLRSLETKLLSAFVAVALLSALVGVLGLRGAGQIGSALHDTTTNLLPSNQALAQTRFALMSALWQTNKGMVALLSHEPERLQLARTRRSEALELLRGGFDRYQALPKQGAEAQQARDAAAALEAWRAVNDETWSVIEGGDAKRAVEITDTRGAQAIGALLEHIGRLLTAQLEAAQRHQADGAQAIVDSTRAIWLAIALALAGALAIGTYLTLSITRPVAKMREASLRIAEGDVDQRIEHEGEDEIGELAASFRRLVAYIKDMARAADALAKGDLEVEVRPRSESDLLSKSFAEVVVSFRGLHAETTRVIEAARAGELDRRADPSRLSGGYAQLLSGVNEMMAAFAAPTAEAVRVLERVAARDLTARASGEYRGDYARMMEALATATANLRDGLGQVATASEQVAAASGQIASTNQAVAAGASDQASALEETSAALTQMAAATRRNAESASHADELSGEARTASNQGAQAMAQMTASMEKIRAAAEGTAAIIRDINEIAFQTNLLALNAAVEAARAGEAGRGFAVVAEEVRNLALRSKEAAKKTESLIQQSMTLAKEGEGITTRVSASLSGIVDAVGSVTTIVGEIARASAEQSQGIEQVTRAMAQVDKATQQAAASSEEGSAAAQELSSQAEALAAMVARFEIGTKGAARRDALASARALSPERTSAAARAKRTAVEALSAPPRRPRALTRPSQPPFALAAGDAAFREF
jgi:methyl-accepting chemotaxis protein